MDEIKEKYYSNNSSYYEDLFKKGISSTENNSENSQLQTAVKPKDSRKKQKGGSMKKNLRMKKGNGGRVNKILSGGSKKQRSEKKNGAHKWKIQAKGRKTTFKKETNGKRKSKGKYSFKTIFD